jgi:hypothetical protein
MAGKRATIEVGDLVEFRSQHKLQKFYRLWYSTAIVTDIYEAVKGKNKGQMIAKIYFATRREYRNQTIEVPTCGTVIRPAWEQVPCNRELKILLKRMKKVR